MIEVTERASDATWEAVKNNESHAFLENNCDAIVRKPNGSLYCKRSDDGTGRIVSKDDLESMEARLYGQTIVLEDSDGEIHDCGSKVHKGRDGVVCDDEEIDFRDIEIISVKDDGEVREGNKFEVDPEFLTNEQIVKQESDLLRMQEGDVSAGHMEGAREIAVRRNELWEEADERNIEERLS